MEFKRTISAIIDNRIKSHDNGRLRKKLHMQGARILRNEAYFLVRRSDEGFAQRRRWTFYEVVIIVIFITLITAPALAGPNDLASQFLTLTIEGDPYRVWFDKGNILYKQMEYKAAVEALSKIGKDAPPDLIEESSYLIANSLMEMDKYDEALSYAGAIPDKSRFYPFALYTKAMVNLKTGNAKVATDYFEELLKYIKSVQPQKVKQTVEKQGQLTELEILTHRTNLTMGFIYLGKDSHTEAIKYFSAVPRESPYHEKALFGLGWAYARTGRWVRSVVFWDELSSKYPDSPYSREVVPYLGYAYTKLNAYGKAIEQNGTTLSYYRDMSAKLSALQNEVQGKDIKKISGAINLLGNKELSDALTLYKGLLSMEEYLGTASPGISYEAEAVINMSKKKREAILDDVYSRVLSDIEKLQQQFLESSIDTTLEMAQNLGLEGGGQISNDMIFVNHD